MVALKPDTEGESNEMDTIWPIKFPPGEGTSKSPSTSIIIFLTGLRIADIYVSYLKILLS